LRRLFPRDTLLPMKIDLLAFTSDPELLDILCSLPTEEHEIIIVAARTIDELREFSQGQRFDAALLDAADTEIPIVRSILHLTDQQPDLKVLILAADDDTNNLQSEGVAYYRLLPRPLNPEQLISFLEELAGLPLPVPTGEGSDQAVDLSDKEAQEPSLIEIIDAADFENESLVVKQQDGGIAKALDSTQTTDLVGSLSEPSASNIAAGRNPEISALRLSYCCVLVPRHPKQYLARALADHAASILPQLHLSRGWRVTGISVRPQYMQWIISLPLDTCPVDAIQEIRQRTSAYFYKTIPELAPAGVNRDFWAQGYLMMSGSQPLSPDIIQELIKRSHPAQPGD